MPVESIARGEDGHFGPAIYEHLPSRTLAYLGAGLILFAGTFLILAYLEIGPFTLVLPIIVAFVLMPLGIRLLCQIFKTSFRVHHHGFAVRGIGDWRAYGWQDVAAVWRITTHTYHGATQSVMHEHSCILSFDDGTKVTLEGITEELSAWTEQEAYRGILPKLQSQWDAGEPIPFGRVSVSKMGIHAGRQVLPWSDIASIKPERNEDDVAIRMHGKNVPWMELRGDNIPNVALFWKIANESLAWELYGTEQKDALWGEEPVNEAFHVRRRTGD